MPRELVHWYVLEEAASRIRSSAPAVHRVIKEHLPEAYIGAVIHDAPYYLRFGRTSFAKVAESMHGSFSEDTFDPVRMLSAKIKQHGWDASFWALVLGMVSHIAADIVFHPVVYYFSGDYYHPEIRDQDLARTRHRLLEVYLDSHFRRRFTPHYNGQLVRAARASGKRQEQLFEFLGAALDTSFSPEMRYSSPLLWKRSFAYMCRLQRAFLSAPLGYFVRLLNSASGGRLKSSDALFSFDRLDAPQAFNKPLCYKNPVSGAEAVSTVEELFESAVESCAELFARFEPILTDPAVEISSQLAAVQGKSLNTGVYRVSVRDAKYFAGDEELWELDACYF